MEKQQLPVGVSDFRKLRAGNYYYLDKSDFIREIIEASGDVILLPRPRRFGKTLNLSMLRCFFEKDGEGTESLFKGLAIEKKECFPAHQRRYPVIWMTLKDVKHPNWNECFQNLKKLICNEFSRHRYLLDGNVLNPEESVLFEKILKNTADITDYGDSLLDLSRFLHRFHDSPPVILIDEYDTPLHAGYREGYYERITGFMRNLLSGGLKDNPHLFKGILTGILRVAKESIFSGLNNLDVYTILDRGFDDCFGFTDDDVRRLLGDYRMSDRYGEAVSWYNGYLFGGKTIYNPWSLINYANRKPKTPKPFWINTADTSMIDGLATRGGREIREEIGQLLEGRLIRLPVYETIVMRDLDVRDDLFWSFLLFSGYLKPVRQIDYETWELGIPNREVGLVYRNLIRTWFATKVDRNQLEEMLKGLETGDVELFERLLGKVVERIMSFHDFGGEPEKVYHALVLGMLVWMTDGYDIRSNRESGYGRYDIMLKPKDGNGLGIVIEFKRVSKAGENAHETVLEEALKQIADREYATELTAAGISDILEIAVAFKGKKLWVKHRRRQSGPR